MTGKANTFAVTAAAALLLSSFASGQTFRRLGACPSLGCVLPPDQSDFLPGQLFDLRLEVHAPVNGSEAFNDGVPDEAFSVSIAKLGAHKEDGKGGEEAAKKKSSIAEFFGVDEEPELERWDFSWYEDLFAEDADTPSVVNVASRIYRGLALYEPGEYEVTLTYYGGETTTARWVVRPLSAKKRAKNVILFIGGYLFFPGKTMIVIFGRVRGC